MDDCDRVDKESSNDSTTVFNDSSERINVIGEVVSNKKVMDPGAKLHDAGFTN